MAKKKAASKDVWRDTTGEIHTTSLPEDRTQIAAKENEHYGGFRVNRVYGGDEPYISLELTDELSGTYVVQVRMSLENFANALTSSQAAVWFKHTGELVGTVAQNKAQFVPAPFSISGQEDKYLTAFEVDGWRARRGDLGNFHRRIEYDGVGGYMVVFFRNVTKDGTPIQH